VFLQNNIILKEATAVKVAANTVRMGMIKKQIVLKKSNKESYV